MASKPILITGGVICLFSASLLLVAGAFTNEGVENLEDFEDITWIPSDYYFEAMENETHHTNYQNGLDYIQPFPWIKHKMA